MGIRTRARSALARILRPLNAAAGISTSAELMDLLSRQQSQSGANVTTDSAMRTTAVYACAKILAEDIAALPLPLYRRLSRGKERVTDHWLFALLQQPNKWQTGFEFRELQQLHLELSGNFYALMTIVRGEVRELLPIAPSRVAVCQETLGGALSYVVRMPDGTPMPVPAERMYHVRGMSIDGVTGISPIAYQRETIGLSMSMVQYGAKLFKNGALIGGVLTHPSTLSDAAADRLKESFDELYSGVDNAHKTILLEEGTSWATTGMKADEAQFLELRQYTRTEIAGIYRVPPHLIGDLSRATFSNIEEQARGYVQYGMLPRLRRLEARMLTTLIPATQRREYFVEHLVDGLLRGDYQKRMAGYQQAIQTGWMTRNEAREMENMNPADEALDEFLTPAFITGAQPPAPSASSNDVSPEAAA